MLIPDLLNILFDQANYETLTIMICLNKRKTKYANRYSVLSYYDMKSANFNCVCKEGLIKTIVHVALCGINVDGAFLQSAISGFVLVVKYLASIRENINVTNDHALHYSASKGHLDVVKYLVGIGANVHSNDDRALLWSAHNGHMEVVKYLISAGANVHADGDYALLGSAGYGHLEVVKYLVGAGANIHAGNDCALQRSAEQGHSEVVKYLVSVYVKNNKPFDTEIIRNNFSST